jgi:hypothetical protein
MSAAICGAVFPGYRGACHRARIRATRWLIRVTPISIIGGERAGVGKDESSLGRDELRRRAIEKVGNDRRSL